MSRATTLVRRSPPPAALDPALARLHGPEQALAELAAPLRSPPRAPLVDA
ncbi:hypothetical protein OG909_02260 [Streptomyces sp. NBC_01754]|nr:hypothetical protein [Streptomyces sp. NBC_01754]WSC91216.1 hypothetical protein OG909_02260 [Streptomyces sp. NBC_01754]